MLRAIRDMANVSAKPELGRVLPSLLQIATEATDSDASSIYLLDERARELVLAGAYPSRAELTQDYLRIPLGSAAIDDSLPLDVARAFQPEKPGTPVSA